MTHIEGWTDDGRRVAVRLTPPDSPAANYAFDVTPARLVTALITERAASAPPHARACLSCSPSGDDGSLENSAPKSAIVDISLGLIALESGSNALAQVARPLLRALRTVLCGQVRKTNSPGCVELFWCTGCRSLGLPFASATFCGHI